MIAAALLPVLALLAGAPGAAPAPDAVNAAAKTITPDVLRGHIRFLSSDLLEGRGPATRGDRLGEEYVATQLEALGVKPAAPDGSWIQKVPVVGITTHAGPLTVSKGGETLTFKDYEDFVAGSGVESPDSGLENAELVFVGYGIVAPEYQWDDFKGADLKGKVLLVMNNDPESDPKLFEGKRRLYYGRWAYKYEQAARMGAAGVVIIHTAPSASYPWKVVQTSWSGEQFQLPHESGPELQVKSWATEDVCRKIARLAGKDLDALRAAAEKRDFQPVPLGVTVTLKLKNDIKRSETGNVIGRLDGSDPVLSKEAVIFSAHHDHLGMKADAKPGEDAIYNGALDNASGVADLLAIARAYTRLPKMTKRSVLFVSFAAEEQGLVGSQYFARHLPVPAARLAVDINIDEANIWGKTKDMVVVGKGKSDLEALLDRMAAADGRVIKDDQFPSKGTFYRSDQLNLAKVGVPSAYFKPGTDVIGKPKGWGAEQQEKFDATDYHQPSDEMRADWNFEGMVEDARFYFRFGVAVANAPKLPQWKPGDEFEAARKSSVVKPSL
jgi:Zn-dependent M28 family amino/carboxypeptidase